MEHAIIKSYLLRTPQIAARYEMEMNRKLVNIMLKEQGETKYLGIFLRGGH